MLKKKTKSLASNPLESMLDALLGSSSPSVKVEVTDDRGRKGVGYGRTHAEAEEKARKDLRKKGGRP